MEVEEQIIRELHQVPRRYYREIPSFIRAKTKITSRNTMTETALASESS